MTCSNEIRVYERMYTKTVIVIESILLTLVLFLAAFKFFQPKFENMQLRNRYSAEDIESMQNYKFDSTVGGYVLSTLHSNFNGRVEIPKKFDGEKVVSIADGAFKNFKDIDEIHQQFLDIFEDVMSKLSGPTFVSIEYLTPAPYQFEAL